MVLAVHRAWYIATLIHTAEIKLDNLADFYRNTMLSSQPILGKITIIEDKADKNLQYGVQSGIVLYESFCTLYKRTKTDDFATWSCICS